MTPTKGVTDEQRGKIYKKINAIIDRTGEGKSLNFDFVIKSLQEIHDGLNFFKPNRFFQGENLLLLDEFRHRILSVAMGVKRFEIDNCIKTFVFSCPTNDFEIFKIKEFDKKKHIFFVDDVCFVIAEMITRQPSGEGGYLVNDGKLNLFVAYGINNEIFVIDVQWDCVLHKWVIFADYPDEDYDCRSGGDLLFVCDCILDK